MGDVEEAWLVDTCGNIALTILLDSSSLMSIVRFAALQHLGLLLVVQKLPPNNIKMSYNPIPVPISISISISTQI
ncbi:hypothetical protein QVD17_14535 [Tagetes erecta]|uniref:Uncharacterized protein n=1 Tax=Tagetes erecta TaxID=13708 RepID=A0AAD8L1B8_TARER|nr:hypothetical protein QVD17_14535 [Tagetes erecta]